MVEDYLHFKVIAASSSRGEDALKAGPGFDLKTLFASCLLAWQGFYATLLHFGAISAFSMIIKKRETRRERERECGGKRIIVPQGPACRPDTHRLAGSGAGHRAARPDSRSPSRPRSN